ncbi:ATPase family protein associated with various cellular activities (AAA) [Saccharothrix carnea]|uniref:ATPase family protein associated with various cellular activities (AAA) n=1 Tax=Saccharothrix carnea TaxID=1280637 RepID=A0A2P8I3W0_SACCR|nr:ATP-binding protein [Saccharothrix carnea]PSL53151.1 ATPase family protein associated with various cellular activities (AAA) [Saccharothrix carnea]
MNTGSLPHLFTRLAALERRIRTAVAARRGADHNPDDPFRGLYLSDEAIDALLATRREPFVPFQASVASGRLGGLAETAGLTGLDVELLLVALAPDVDSRFEQFYGYLNDDVTRRRATAGLALRLCGLPEASAAGRARLDPASPLRSAGLLVVDDRERPFLSRSLRVPDRVVSHLLGDDLLDAALAGVARVVDDVAAADVGRLGRALRARVKLLYLRERPGGGAAEMAAAALRDAGFAVLEVDAARLRAEPDQQALTAAVRREAVLRHAGVVLGPVEEEPPLAALTHPTIPLVVFGPNVWDPRWSTDPPLPHDASPLPVADRAELWRAGLDGSLAPEVDPAAATAHFVLGPGQIARAARAASVSALVDGGVVTTEHLRAGARSQNAAGLHRLARRIEPAVDWHDLVLPAGVVGLLHELASRARHRDRVIDEWRMRPGGGRGRGVTGLFAGDSGTGKTMSAEVIAASLGLDLYTVNLATVVDKYIGETEKNLERIFTEAAGVNGVLLFDEADAIFGKRSEVRDAHDRYANIESAYLLQRMETFDGIAVLATNLRANLDEAFTRRLDVVVDFPVPDEPLRRLLWDRCLGVTAPRVEVDLDFLASAFELAGGHIRSAAVTAAYLAAEAGGPVGMAEVVGAVAREYRKLGRLVGEREFGRYLELAMTSTTR